MKTYELYSKAIDRELNPVIKFGREEEAKVKQELEEYVVTKELQRCFRDFFAAYKKGILGSTEAMGVWIAGFFGSGKSHFLKILSYLLGNKEVNGKRAIQYFIDDGKIADAMTIADMRLAADTPTDVIAFDIASKSETANGNDKDSIVSVFLKVFNEMQGFYGANPYIADLERNLTKDGKYEEFRRRFEEIAGETWIEARNDFDFNQGETVDTLVAIDYMSEENAQNWCNKAFEPYTFSIERFAELVKKYIDSKGKNHHVVFLVDEISQYVDNDSRLTLDLQTITEDLGKICHGKAWIIVTAQQEIDTFTKIKGEDFSKILGRFETRISLSEANVDEVVRKRILYKTDVATQTLSVLYDSKATIIKNLVLFNDGIEKKLYSDRVNFAEVYPFIPYQFNLLSNVLTAIRIHSAVGRQHADGARSMLALFKKAAMRIKDAEIGELVPFYYFYDALEEDIEASYRNVIYQANENEMINPDHNPNCFDVSVLKALFLVKYVKEIKANSENIASLMVTKIDDDRLKIVQQVEDALKRLIKQTLVQKNNDEYVFLTYDEQEITRAIEKQDVTSAEVTNKVAELIFDGLFDEKKYKYPTFNNRYAFAFNQLIDDKPYKGSQGYDLSLKIITPNRDEFTNDASLRLASGQSNTVFVVLPDDRAFLDEIIASAKIEKFLRFDSVNSVAKYEEIKNSKRTEMREHNANAKTFLSEALKIADIYVCGDKLQTASNDIAARINEALEKLVVTVYHKLSYITAAMSETDIRALIRANNGQISFDFCEGNPNVLALNDVRAFIDQNSSRHTKTSMKSVMDRFMKAPYGYVEDDIRWLVAKLFKSGNIALFVNSEAITVANKDEDDIIRFITKKEFVEKLMMEKKEKPGEAQVKSVRNVMKELFNVTSSADDEDSLMKSCQGYALSLKNDLDKIEIQYQIKPFYPGKPVIALGKRLMIEMGGMEFTNEFFTAVHIKKDDYLDFAEKYAPVRAFFEGEQKNIFDKSVNLMKIYDDSRTFIVDKDIDSVAAEIKKILKMQEPYSSIYKLPSLNDKYKNMYSAFLGRLAGPIKKDILDARTRVLEELNGKKCEDILKGRFIARFEELYNKADTCDNVAVLQSIKMETDALKIRLLNEIAAEELKLTEQNADDGENGNKETPETLTPQHLKKKKTISIKSINNLSTWRIESKDDVDRYIEELKKKLYKTLEEDTIINIEF